MAQFELHKKEIESLGGSLLFVAAEKRSGMFAPEKFFEKSASSFPFLLDEDRAVTKAYGIYKALSFDSIHIARPATFVISREGNIRFLYVGTDQTDRAPMENVLAALRSAA